MRHRENGSWNRMVLAGVLGLTWGVAVHADTPPVPSVAPAELSPYMNSIPPGTEYLCVGTGPTNQRLHPDRAPHTELAMQDGVVLFSGTAPQQGLNFTLNAGDLTYRNQMSTLGSPEPPPQVGTAGMLLQRPWYSDQDKESRRLPWSEARWHQGEDISWQGYRVDSSHWLEGAPYWKYSNAGTSATLAATTAACAENIWSGLDLTSTLTAPVIVLNESPVGLGKAGLSTSVNLQLARGTFQLAKPIATWFPPVDDDADCSAYFREPWFHGRGLDPVFGHQVTLPNGGGSWRLAEDYYPNYLNIYPFEKLELDGGRLKLDFERSATWPRRIAAWSVDTIDEEPVGTLSGGGLAGTVFARQAHDEYGNRIEFDRVPQYGWETDYKVPHKSTLHDNSNSLPALRSVPQAWRLPYKRLRTVQLRDKSTPDTDPAQWTIAFIYEHPESDRISATDTAVAVADWTEGSGRQPNSETWIEWKSIYSHLPQSDWDFGRLPELNDETTLLTVQAYRANASNPDYTQSLRAINGAPFQDDFSVWASTIGQDAPQYRMRVGRRVDPLGQYYGGANAACPGICEVDDDGDGLIDEDCQAREKGHTDWGSGCAEDWLNDDNETGGLDDEVSTAQLPLDNTDGPDNANADDCPGICDIDDDGDGVIDEDTNGYQAYLLSDVEMNRSCLECSLNLRYESDLPHCYQQPGFRFPWQTHIGDPECPNPFYWREADPGESWESGGKADPFAVYDDDEDGLIDEDGDQNPLLVDMRSIQGPPDSDDADCATGKFPFVPRNGKLPTLSSGDSTVNEHCRSPLSEAAADDPWVYQVQYVYARSNPYWLLRGRNSSGQPISHDMPPYFYHPDFAEPFTDVNNNGVWDSGEPLVDYNQNGLQNTFLGNVHRDCLPNPRFRTPAEANTGEPLSPSDVHLIKRIVRMREDAFEDPYDFTEQTWLYRYNDIGFLKAVFDPAAVNAVIGADAGDSINEPDDILTLGDAHEVAGVPLIYYAAQWYTYYNPYVDPVVDADGRPLGIQQCYEKPPVLAPSASSGLFPDFDPDDPSSRLPNNACDGQAPWVDGYQEELHTDPDCSSFMPQDCGWCYARNACGQSCPTGECVDEECYCTESPSSKAALRQMGISGAQPRLRKYMVKTARVRGADGEMHTYRFDYLSAESDIDGQPAILSYADPHNITIVDEMVEQTSDEAANESGRSDFYIYEDDFRLDLDSGPPDERYIHYSGARRVFPTSSYLYNPSKVKTRRVVVMNYYGIAISDRLILTPGFDGDQTSLVDNQQFELLNTRGQAKHIFDPSWVAGWREKGLAFIKSDGRVLTQLFGGPEGWQTVLTGLARGSGGGNLYGQQCNTPQVLNDVPVQRVTPDQLSAVMAAQLYEKTGQPTTLPKTHAVYYRAGAKPGWVDPADTVGMSTCSTSGSHSVPNLANQEPVLVTLSTNGSCPTDDNDGAVHTCYHYDFYYPDNPKDESVKFKYQWTEPVPAGFGGTGSVALQIEYYDRSGRLRFVGRGAGTEGTDHPTPAEPFLVDYIGYDELGRPNIAITDIDTAALTALGSDVDVQPGTINSVMGRKYTTFPAAAIITENVYNDAGLLTRQSVGTKDASNEWTSVDHTEFRFLGNRTILHKQPGESKLLLDWQDPFMYLLEYQHTRGREESVNGQTVEVRDVWGTTSVTVLDKAGRFVEQRVIGRRAHGRGMIDDFGWGISLADYTHDLALDGWNGNAYKSGYWSDEIDCHDGPVCYGLITGWVDNGHQFVPPHPRQENENAVWPPANDEQIITLARSFKRYTQSSTLKPTQDIVFSTFSAPNVTESGDRREMVTHYLYDLEDRVARQQDADGVVTRLLYDSKRRATKIFRGSRDGCADWFPPTYSTTGDDMVLVEHRLFNDGTSACEHSPMAGSDECTTLTDNEDWPYDANRLVRIRRFADDAESCTSPYVASTRSRDEQFQYDWRGRVVLSRELAVGFGGTNSPQSASTVAVTTTVYDNVDRPLVVATWTAGGAPELERVRAWQESGDYAPDLIITECLTRGPGRLPLSISETIYDERGRVFEQRQYDPRPLAETNGAKRYTYTRTYRDELDRVLRETTPHGVTTYEHDSLGRVVSMSTWSKETGTYGMPAGVQLTRTQSLYDIFGNVLIQVHFDFLGATGVTAASTGTGVSFNVNGSQITIQGTLPTSNYVVTYTYNWYDEGHRLVATANWGTAGPHGLTSGTPSIAYVASNAPIWTSAGGAYDYYIGGIAVDALVSRFGYDLADRRIWTQNAKGIVTRTWYDLLGRTLLVAENWRDFGANTGPLNSQGNPTDLTPNHTGPIRYTAYHYTRGGLQDAIVAILPDDPAANITPANITWTEAPKKDFAATTASVPGAQVQVTSLIYGATLVNDSDHGESISLAPNLVGQIRYPTKVPSNQSSTSDTLTFTYTAQGQVAQRTDQRGIKLDFLNDLPESCSTCLPGPPGSPTKVQVTYTDPGTDPAHSVHSVDHLAFDYDSRGLLTSAELYGPAGSPTTLESVITFDYDPMGNLLSETLDPAPGSAPSLARTTSYAWHWSPDAGTPGPAATGPGSMRLHSITYPATAADRMLRFDYDGQAWSSDVNRVTGLSTVAPSGTLLHTLLQYQKSGGGRTIKKIWGDPIDTGVPGEMAPPVTLDYTNGGLDRFGRIGNMTFRNSLGDPIHQYAYTYDKNGNRTSARITQAGHDNDRSYAYTYDRLDRLVNAERGVLSGGQINVGGTGQEWNLDLLGNWTGVPQREGHIEYTIGNAVPGYDEPSDVAVRVVRHAVNRINALTAVTQTIPDNTTTEHAHDAAGNLIDNDSGLDRPADERRQFRYDAWNRVVKVLGHTGATIATYDYDALGRRIAKHLGSTGSEHEYYYYDGHRVVELYKGTTGNLSLHRQYVYGANYIDEVAAYYDPAGVHHFVLQDAGYDVVGVTSSSGVLEQQYSYDPYGKDFAVEDGAGAPATGPRAIDMAYKGMWLDAETGLYATLARLYDPLTGRWLQRDPNGVGLMARSMLNNGLSVSVLQHYGDGPNIYQFAKSNPVVGLDPFGLDMHHLVPIALGGDPKGPIVSLTKEEHDRVHKYWREQGLWFKEDQRAFWGKEEVRRGELKQKFVDAAKREELVRNSLIAAGIDVMDSETTKAMEDALRQASAERVPKDTPGAQAGREVKLRRIAAAADLPEVGSLGTRASREQFKKRISPGGPRQAKRTLGDGGTLLAFAGAGIAMGVYSSDASAAYAELVQLSQSIGHGGPSLYQEIEALDIIKDMNVGLGGNNFTVYYGWNYWREMHGAYTSADQNFFWAR